MKHHLNINQFAAKELGLLGKIDLIDLCLFDSFKSFANSARCEKIIDENGFWFWISYSSIIAEIPFSGLNSKDIIYRRMKKLESAGIIIFHPNNQKMNKTFFRWGANYDAMERTAADIEPTVKKTEDTQDLRLKKRTPTVKKTEVPTVKKTDNPLTINNPLTKPIEIKNNEIGGEENQKRSTHKITVFAPPTVEELELEDGGNAAYPSMFVDNSFELKRLLEDYRVKEVFSMSRKIPSEKFEEYVRAFGLEVDGREKKYFNVSSFREHFFSFSAARWRGEQASKQQKTSKKGPNNFGSNPDKYLEKQAF